MLMGFLNEWPIDDFNDGAHQQVMLGFMHTGGKVGEALTPRHGNLHCGQYWPRVDAFVRHEVLHDAAVGPQPALRLRVGALNHLRSWQLAGY